MRLVANIKSIKNKSKRNRSSIVLEEIFSGYKKTKNVKTMVAKNAYATFNKNIVENFKLSL